MLVPVTVTGSFNGPDGSPLAEGTLLFRTRRWDLVGSDVVVPNTISAPIVDGAVTISAYASADGEKRIGFDVDLEYTSAANGRVVRESIARNLVIPNAASVALGDLLNDPLALGNIVSLDIQLRQELRDARDQSVTASEASQRWAESATSPDGTTSKSAKTWAGEAGATIAAGVEAAATSATNAATSATNAANSAASAAQSAINAAMYDGKLNARAFGAIGDGAADDTAAIRSAVTAASARGGGTVLIDRPCRVTPQANAQAIDLPGGVFIEIAAGGELIMDTDDADDPNVTVQWDVIRASGARTERSGVMGPGIIRYLGGARNNCASVAVRNGATMVDVIGVDFQNAIASAVVIEGSVLAPYDTYCRVVRCNIANTQRHGVYLVGAKKNYVQNNRFDKTKLESVALRLASENDVTDNTIIGDGTALPVHAVALAQPPSGVYVTERLKILRNRFDNIPGAFFYGQGLGNILRDSDISGNEGTAMLAGTNHAFMLYRLENCHVRDNIVSGGRNRAFMFYGCSGNDVVGNTVRNVNSLNNPIGAMVFGDYTDPADSSVNYSTGNLVHGNSVIDTRGSPLHVYGIQFLAGSSPNRIGVNTITGVSSARYFAPDGWQAFDLPPGAQRAWNWVNIPSGSTALTQMPVIADTFADVVTERGWLKSLTLIARQTMTSGTITATIYRNGSAWRNVTLTGNGSNLVASVYYAPEENMVVPGDVLTCFFTGSSVVTGTPVDILVRAGFAA